MNTVIVNNEHDRHLFLLDEVVFEVDYDNPYEEANSEIFPNVINDFLDQGEDGSWRKRLAALEPGNARIIDFPSPTTQFGGFALIPLKISERIAEDPLDPVDVLTLLNEAYTELGDSFPFEFKDKTSGNPLGIRLLSISPNWLASDLHHGGSTGGPGSMPAKKPVPLNDQNKFELKGNRNGTLDRLLLRKPEISGEGIEVIILDTAIPFDGSVEITVDIINGQEIKENVAFPPELKAMLAGIEGHPDYPGYPYMEIIRYPYQDDLTNCDPLATWPHHYEMPDHGTFIASIIRAISPSVKIYLYEALNRFGVGSLISIAQGVANAVNQRGDSHIPVLVMNCSFMLERDLEDERFLEKLKSKWNIKWSAFDALRKAEVQDLLRASMRDVFEWVSTLNPNIVVVAAAGNDGPFDDDEGRALPHYPAAFDNVLSVSALPKGNRRNRKAKETDSEAEKKNSLKYMPSTYSNLANADDPNKEAFSFATFGGDLVNGTSKPVGGVLGIYIGGIPTQNNDGTFNPGPTNITGWAQWSGTSFATPIISALLAAKESELSYGNENIPPTDRPLITGRPYRTVDDENVILIRQGD